ncbi:Trk system potassium transporter TrkA [Myxococcota bacterium]|nr:Trk system potassium transporter TrkA [Myxococcota bacterium]
MAQGQIVIVGGGLVGQTLAHRLTRIGHDVTLVERNEGTVRELSETLDVRLVEGNGATSPVLREAGIEQAELVVAATESDAANMVVGLLAAHVFQTPRVVVRVRDVGHEEGFERGCSDEPMNRVCINPDTASVDRIANLLDVPGAVDVMQFFGGDVLVAGFRISEASDFAGLRVSDMKLLFAATPTLAVAIERSGRWLVPGGGETIAAGDLVYFAIASRDLDDVLSLVGVPMERRRGRVMISGASSIGLALARRLDAVGVRVVVIENDGERARQAASELEHVLVIHGRGTDQALLEDEEIESVAAFVALSDDHETNLAAGLLARRLGCGRSIVLVDNPAMASMVGDIGIDAIISPRLLTIAQALRYIRGGGVRAGAALLGDAIDILQIEVEQPCRLTSGCLADLDLPSGVLVAALRRQDALLFPSGETQVAPGDEILIISTTDLSGRVREFIEA